MTSLLVALCVAVVSCSDQRLAGATRSKDNALVHQQSTDQFLQGLATKVSRDGKEQRDPPLPATENLSGNAPASADPTVREAKLRNGDYIMAMVPGGFVQRNAYYTATELSNSAYELGFRNHHPVRCEDGEAFVRREIRWYEPTAPEGERCGAAIHVARCKGEKLDELATERIRAQLIALEPERSIAPHCGADPAEVAQSENMFDRQKRQIVQVHQSSPCQYRDITPDHALQVSPTTTRFGVRTFVDAELTPNGQMVGDLEALRRAPEIILGTAAYAAGEQDPQFMESGTVPQQGANIAIEQHVTRSGRGYCISLTATQGRRVWRRGFDRPAGTSPVGPEKGWSAPLPPVLRDAHALARALRNSLQTKPFSLKDR